MVLRDEQKILEFLKEHLELRIVRYVVPSGATIQLVLCDEILSEVTIRDVEEESSFDGY
jgi:hypothetical protein